MVASLIQYERQHGQARPHLVVAPIDRLSDEIIQMLERGSRITLLDIKKCAGHEYTAQEAIVVEFNSQALGLIKTRHCQGVLSVPRGMVTLMDEDKCQPGCVMERALNALAFSQILGNLRRVAV